MKYHTFVYNAYENGRHQINAAYVNNTLLLFLPHNAIQFMVQSFRYYLLIQDDIFASHDTDMGN